LQGFPWPEQQSDAIGEGEMKAHLQVIFTLDELAAYLKVGKRSERESSIFLLEV